MTIRFFNQYVRVPFLLLAGLEALILIASVYLAAYLRFTGDSTAVEGYVGPLWPRAIIYAAAILICMGAMGLYQGRVRLEIPQVMIRIAIAYGIASVLLILFFYVLPGLYIGRGVLALATIISFLGLGTLRPVFYHKVDEDLLKRRVVFLGAGRKAVKALEQMRRKTDQRGFKIIGFIAGQEDDVAVEKEQLCYPEMNLSDWVEENEIDEIVVAFDERRDNSPHDELLKVKLSGTAVTDLVSFVERETGRVHLDLFYPSWLIFCDSSHANNFRMFSKRLFDFLISVGLIVLSAPIMLGAILAIRLDSRAGDPILYRQQRVGENNEVFNVLKFRSMTVDAEADGKARWASTEDDRITRVGRFLRNYRIDELPQLLNVLKGEMSLVGPRPERPVFVAELNEKIPYYSARHYSKPGVTGWAQLNYPYGASLKDAETKLEYDLFYVKNNNFLLDMLILLQTAEVVLFGKGAR